MDLAPYIRNVPDFPKPGIQFKDITTLLQHPRAFQYIVDTWKERYTGLGIDAVAGTDARGFIFSGALAYAMELPLILIRKQGKLPSNSFSESYDLEYGQATLEVHHDALKKGERVVIVDDLLATGGTVGAAIKLMDRLGAHIVEAAFVIELTPLNGREKLSPVPVHSLIEFEVD
jgi:adenine phosphoribosyltransferase